MDENQQIRLNKARKALEQALSKVKPVDSEVISSVPMTATRRKALNLCAQACERYGDITVIDWLNKSLTD